jgi:hypothetical protein
VKIEQKDGEVILKGSDGTEVWIIPADDSDTAYPVANLADRDTHTLEDGSTLMRRGGLDVWVTPSRKGAKAA